MKRTKCEVIRRELDEVRLGDEGSTTVVEHLRDCPECQSFNQKQRKLRQIVGSLGTVEAPADFDFRLRARLARESNGAVHQLKAIPGSWARVVFATVTALVLFAGFASITYFLNQQRGVKSVAETEHIRVPEPYSPTAVDMTGNDPKETATATVPRFSEASVPKQKEVRASQSSPRVKRPITAVEFASEGAQVLTEQTNADYGTSAVFPIDTSMQSLKVSLDDGRGNARTISVPSVSFGSQRVLSSGNQFAPKGVW